MLCCRLETQFTNNFFSPKSTLGAYYHISGPWLVHLHLFTFAFLLFQCFTGVKARLGPCGPSSQLLYIESLVKLPKTPRICQEWRTNSRCCSVTEQKWKGIIHPYLWDESCFHALCWLAGVFWAVQLCFQVLGPSSQNEIPWRTPAGLLTNLP